MKYKESRYLILCLLFFFCTKNPKTGTSYFPLIPGKEWVYTLTVLDWEEGEVDTVETGQLILSLGEKVSFEGKELYPVRAMMIFPTAKRMRVLSDTFSATFYWEENEGFIGQYRTLGAQLDTFLLLPLEKGKEWRFSSLWTFLIRDDPHYYIARSEGKDTVRVGQEKFSDAQKIRYWGEEIEGTFYLVKEYGVVKWDDREGEEGSFTEYIFEWQREE